MSLELSTTARTSVMPLDALVRGDVEQGARALLDDDYVRAPEDVQRGRCVGGQEDRVAERAFGAEAGCCDAERAMRFFGFSMEYIREGL